MRSFAALGVAFAVAALAGCGSDDISEARVVSIDAAEFEFRASEAIVIAAGDTIRFEVRNVGTIEHELEVLTDASRRLGRTERIQPGQTGAVTVSFDAPGVYTVICDVDNHRSLGQQAQFTVVEA